MGSHTTDMQVVRRRYARQIECQLVTALSSRVLYAIFRLSFADTGVGAFLDALLGHRFGVFAGGVGGSSNGPGLIFGRAWGLRGRVFALVYVCW